MDRSRLRRIGPSIEFCRLGASSVENKICLPENMGGQNGRGHMCLMFASYGIWDGLEWGKIFLWGLETAQRMSKNIGVSFYFLKNCGALHLLAKGF
jgi:hypothetical protein